MAFASNCEHKNCVLKEEQILCSICLEVFTKPVSTPCGHSFCLHCITRHWETSNQCVCPLCKKSYNHRPELHVNTIIADMADQMKSLGVAEVKEPVLIKPALVPHDVGTKLKAVQPCLVDPALEEHCRSPVEKLEDSHQAHHAVPIGEESEEGKIHPRTMRGWGDMEERLQEMRQKMKALQQSARIVMTEEEEDVEDVRKEHTSLTSSCDMEERLQEMRQKMKALQQSARIVTTEEEEDVEDVRKEHTSLTSSCDMEKQQRDAGRKTPEMRAQLEQEPLKLSHSEDHLHLLKTHSALPSLPQRKDEAGVRDHGDDVCVEPVCGARSQLQEVQQQLRWMRKCSVDVRLDPDTAHPDLTLSADGKQVRLGERSPNVRDKPGRFDYNVCVLGKDGFSSGRFYFEVEVKNKTRWIVGVARESVDRKGPFTRSPARGHWAVGLQTEVGYVALAEPDLPLSLSTKPQKLGVFVDYEKGEVTFYDVEVPALIHSFTGCVFREKVFPCLSTGTNRDGKNSAALIISPAL